jgi:hypothetical protein
MRLIGGLMKGPILGVIVGAAVGFGFFKLGAAGGGFLLWFTYGVVGAVVGFLCGKPVWRQTTIWTPLVKAIFGFGVGIGLYFLWIKALHDPFSVPAIQEVGLTAPARASTVTFVLGGLIGLVWGGLVGLDEAFGDDERVDDASEKTAAKKKRRS